MPNQLKYSLDFLQQSTSTMWVTDTGILVTLSGITGNNIKGGVVHVHFDVTTTKRVIVRTLAEVQEFTKI